MGTPAPSAPYARELEEEAWTDAMGRIVERDFFPDLRGLGARAAARRARWDAHALRDQASARRARETRGEGRGSHERARKVQALSSWSSSELGAPRRGAPRGVRRGVGVA